MKDNVSGESAAIIVRPRADEEARSETAPDAAKIMYDALISRRPQPVNQDVLNQRGCGARSPLDL